MSEHKKNKNNRSGNQLLKTGMVWTILLAALAAVFVLSIAIGSSGYPLSEVLRGLWDTEAGKIRIIVFNLRLPRAVLAIMVGACLSAAGAILQAVMRNPLADPGTIGVSAGAGAAAITILLLFPSLTYSVPLFAFGGAALACVLIYLLAWKDGVDPVRIILSGVAVNSVLGGYNSFLQLQNSDNLNGVLSFMNGSFSGGNWTQVRVMAVYAVIGLVLACFCIRNANALQLGDEMAKNLGIRVNASRIVLSGVSAFLAAATVSEVGMIGFVGLVAPHIARMLVGSDYKVLLPTSILTGSVMVLLADTVGRTIWPGTEIPVGVMMSVFGGPFFLYMLRKASGLQIGYGEHVIVNQMDVSIARDKITTIIGPNGSGKSTLLKALTRLIRYQKGNVLLDGCDIQTMKPKALAKKLGVLPQIHTAPSDFLVKELVGYGRMPHQKLMAGKSKEDEEVIRWAMEVTGTWKFRDKSIYEISGGETQRVWIATVLAQKPEIMFLDEPTTYLDISHQLETMNLVKKLNRETGIGVVMVLHDLAQAMEVSDHVIVIRDGEKYDEGAPQNVITSKMMKDVYQVECEILNVPGREKPLLAYAAI